MKNDDYAAKSAITKLIRDANMRLGHPNLKPGVKLEAREIYPVDVTVTLGNNGGVEAMPESHKLENVKKGAPFVLITGIGEMSGRATVSRMCSRYEEAWAISSCDTTTGWDLVISIL